MSLLQPFLTKSGWIYCQHSLHDGPDNRKGHPMFIPDDMGDRLLFGAKYTKHVCGRNNGVVKQPYPLYANIAPWVTDVPSDQILIEANLTGSFAKWLDSGDSRVSAIKAILGESVQNEQSVGIGGSSAFGQFRSTSDVDIIIFGKDYVAPCLNVLRQLVNKGTLTLSTPELADRMAKRYHTLYNGRIDLAATRRMFENDVSKCHLSGDKISFIFTYADDEKDCIPKAIYSDGEDILITGTVVSEEEESWLFPRKYLVEDGSGKVWEVWTHHWLFKAVANKGESVTVVASQVSENQLVISSLNHSINLK